MSGNNARNMREKNERVHIAVVKQMVILSTAAFGIVAALAWNEAIRELLNIYIKPYLPGSGVISLFIYAIIVTVVAVLVTLYLTKLQSRLENK
jgi:uncharacterized membrane protein (DUF106 family)